MSENDFAQGFGTNEWIVEDMREAYLADMARVFQRKPAVSSRPVAGHALKAA